MYQLELQKCLGLNSLGYQLQSYHSKGKVLVLREHRIADRAKLC